MDGSPPKSRRCARWWIRWTRSPTGLTPSPGCRPSRSSIPPAWGFGAAVFRADWWCGRSARAAHRCLATSPDLRHWRRHGVILPAYHGAWITGWTKSGAIVPERINGKWWMYYLGTRRDPDGKDRDYMGLASSDDLLHWSDATEQPVLDRRPGAFDDRVMEPGPPPLVTSAGILLLYNGANDKLVFGPGWIIFDKADPRRVVTRCEKPFMMPSLVWERVGTVS